MTTTLTREDAPPETRRAITNAIDDLLEGLHYLTEEDKPEKKKVRDQIEPAKGRLESLDEYLTEPVRELTRYVALKYNRMSEKGELKETRALTSRPGRLPQTLTTYD